MAHTHASPRHRPRRANFIGITIAVGAAVVVGLLCVFLVPWFVPVGGPPVSSDSWGVGFNNRFAVISLAATGLFVMLLSVRWRAVAVDAAVEADAAEPRLWWGGRLTRPSNWILVPLLVVVVGWSTALISYGVHAYGEADFFLDRAQLAWSGLSPYRDFEFTYGPGMVYGVAYAARMAMRLGLSHLAGYTALTALAQAAGILMLAWMTSLLGVRKRAATIALGVLGGYSIVHWLIWQGLQAGPIRFLGPMAAAFALHHLCAFVAQKRVHAGAGAVAAAGIAVAAFVVSPEAGIAYYIAGGVMLGYALLSGSRPAVGMLAGHLASAPLVWVAFGADYLRSVLMFGGGGGNLPIVPNPATLAFFALVLWVGWALPTLWAETRPSERGVLIGAVLIAAVSSVAALGRADFPHIFFNSMPLMMLGIAGMGRLRPRLLAPSLLVLAGLMLVTVANDPIRNMFGVIALIPRTELVSNQRVESLAMRAGMQPEQARQLVALSMWDGPQADVRRLRAVPGPVAAPYGLVADTGFAIGPRQNLGSTYYYGAMNVVSEADWRRQRVALSKIQSVLIPTGMKPAGESGATRTPEPWGALIWWPAPAGFKRDVRDWRGELDASIRREFRYSYTNGPYDVWVRVTPSSE